MNTPTTTPSADPQESPSLRSPSDFSLTRYEIDLTSHLVSTRTVSCEDLEDVLGGIARGFKLLKDCPVDDAYDPQARLIMNLGILSGTQFMTGLRTYFLAYSPLKRSRRGLPSAMWSAGSGKFGTKLRFLEVDEVILTGRSQSPILLHIQFDDDEQRPVFRFEEAGDLYGLLVNDKIQTLHDRFPDAHFAVIGPAGEHYRQVRFAAIALSTENQLKSGDPKPRFCGRGGMGGVMGSKNLLAIVADTPDKKPPPAPPELKSLNQEVARGDGSRRFRDAKTGGAGGTWANYQALNPVHAMPECNFTPTGTDASVPLHRPNVEDGPHVIKDEACYRCGIRCHKNVYDKDDEGKAGRFRAKLDYEPLNLLSSNIGIFDVDQACDLVEQVDQFGMDSISCGVTLSYTMEYNRRHADDGKQLAAGLSYGDFEAARRTIEEIGGGRLDQLGQGVLRLSESVGEPEYAMHSKGVEFPAYLPQTNPGYPWALAGGHMSMRTYLLLLNERETGIDYWVEAITGRGLSILRDDIIGICKFAGMGNDKMVLSIRALTGLDIDVPALENVVVRTFLRGYRLELAQGFTADDYVLPAEVHREYPQIELPYFNTPEFFDELRREVTARFDAMLQQAGL